MVFENILNFIKAITIYFRKESRQDSNNTFLARKISRAKWEKKPGFADKEIPADTVTSDLKTTGNTLSFWEFPNADDRLWKEAAVAIASTWERLDSLDITWIGRDEFQNVGLLLKKTDGDTCVADLEDKHIDVIYIDATRLATIARLLAESIREKQNCHRVTRSGLLALIVEAVRANRIDIERLKPSVRQEVENKL